MTPQLFDVVFHGTALRLTSHVSRLTSHLLKKIDFMRMRQLDTLTLDKVCLKDNCLVLERQTLLGVYVPENQIL